jgi:hypothetical protein
VREASFSETKSRPQRTHRQPKAVGFLFPASGCKPQRQMNNDDRNAPESEQPAAAEIRYGLARLSDIYLGAGLPLELAVRSAIADFQLFERELLCAS